MNREAFKLARDTLRTAVREYGWRRNWGKREIPGVARYRYTYGPCRFEGEHWSIVHYVYVALDCGDVDEPLYDGDTVAADLMEVSDVEREAFQFKADTQFVALWYSPQGFLTLQELTADEYDRLREAYSNQDTEE